MAPAGAARKGPQMFDAATIAQHRQYWCSASNGSECCNGLPHHGIACTPATLDQAREWMPACLFDDLEPRRTSGRPVRPEWMKR